MALYNPSKFMETNSSPSLVNTSTDTGVASSLNVLSKDAPHFDNMTLEDMRGNILYSRFDDIDKVGLAQKQIIQDAKVIKSKSKTIRAFNDHARKVNIPSKK